MYYNYFIFIFITFRYGHACETRQPTHHHQDGDRPSTPDPLECADAEYERRDLHGAGNEQVPINAAAQFGYALRQAVVDETVDEPTNARAWWDDTNLNK